MDASDSHNLEAPFSAAEAAKLLDLFGDHDSFFEMDFSLLLDTEHTTASVPLPLSILDDPRFQFESSAALAVDSQLASVESLSCLKTMKTRSTYQRQKEELAYLRSKIAELEAQLSGLRDRDRHVVSSTELAETVDQSLRGKAASPSLWEVVANRQLSERNRAETENVKLHKLVREQVVLAKSLKRMLQRRLVPLKPLQYAEQHPLVEVREQDSSVFQALLHNIEGRLKTVNNIFETHRLTIAVTDVNSTRFVPNEDGQGVHVELLNARKIAVDPQMLSSTVWTLLGSKQMAPVGQSVSVVKFTDEVLMMKQVMQPPSNVGSTSESTIMLTVLKRVTQANRVLLLWECLTERTGAVGSGRRSPVGYLSDYGCAQIMRADSSNTGGRPGTLAHSYARVTPIQMTPVQLVGPNQTPPVDSKADLDMMVALYHINQHNFLQFIEMESEGVVRDMDQVHL